MKHRRATALIVVLGLLTTLVILATSFFSLAAERRGLAEQEARRQRTSIFLDEVEDRIIAQILEEQADPEGFTSHRSPWYLEHMPVDLSGDQTWAMDYRGMATDPEQNVRSYEELWAGWEGGRTSPSPPSRRWYHWPIDQLEVAGEGSEESEESGYEGNFTSHSRWIEQRYLDERLQPIPFDAADPRGAARFALRYAAIIFDNNGMLRPDAGWPDEPPTSDPKPPSGALSDPAYLRWLQYRNYTNRYARAAKSMLGATNFREESGRYAHTQRLPTDMYKVPWWPFDREIVTYNADGSFAGDGPHYYQWRDQRVRLGNLFRKNGMRLSTSQHAGDEGQLFYMLARGAWHYGHIWPYYYKRTSFTTMYEDLRMWAGQARGMLDADLGGDDPVNVPWRINALTASVSTLGGMVWGLSDRLKIHGNTELFGRGYPEAFPLSHDSGRLVSVVGSSSTRLPSGVFTAQTRAFQIEEATVPLPDRLDYWCDMVSALEASLRVLREVHTYHWKPTSISTLIVDPGDADASTPPEIRQSMIEEFLRILGEDVDVATNVSHGLLANGYGEVGYGGAFHLPSGDNTDRTSDQNFPRRNAFLPPGSDSRAMEYMLNDFMISLFGAANPTWEPGDGLNGVAVDFNNDGMTESTVTGWWDGERTVWSFWSDGLGPDEHLDADPLDKLPDVASGHLLPDWMQTPGWYRIAYSSGKGRHEILRWDGEGWADLFDTYGPSERDLWVALNRMWLNQPSKWANGNSLPGSLAGEPPIKPFSHTGRLFVGKSDTFTLFMRAELYDLEQRETSYQMNRELRIHVDPGTRPEDWYASYSRDFRIQTGNRY